MPHPLSESNRVRLSTTESYAQAQPELLPLPQMETPQQVQQEGLQSAEMREASAVFRQSIPVKVETPLEAKRDEFVPAADVSNATDPSATREKRWNDLWQLLESVRTKYPKRT